MSHAAEPTSRLSPATRQDLANQSATHAQLRAWLQKATLTDGCEHQWQKLGSSNMICMTIKVKHLPPTQAPFEARLKKALRLNRDPVLFYAHQTGYQELGGSFLVTAAQRGMLLSGRSLHNYHSCKGLVS